MADALKLFLTALGSSGGNAPAGNANNVTIAKSHFRGNPLGHCTIAVIRFSHSP